MLGSKLRGISDTRNNHRTYKSFYRISSICQALMS